MGVKLDWQGHKIIIAAHNGAISGTKQVGADLRSKSEALCPKKRGYSGGLVSTAYTKIDEKNQIVYVGYKAPHTHLQHENLQYHHKNGESAKFLEKPLLEHKDEYLATLADELRKALS